MTPEQFVTEVVEAMVDKAYLPSHAGQPRTVVSIEDGVVTYRVHGLLSLQPMRLAIGEFLRAIAFRDDGGGNVLPFPSQGFPRGLPPGPGDAA